MLTVVEKESQELNASLNSSQKECEELKKEHSALLQWKWEKETLVNETEAVQKELKDKISLLEQSLASVSEATEELKVKSCWLSKTHSFRWKAKFDLNNICKHTIIIFNILFYPYFKYGMTNVWLLHSHHSSRSSS